jgi:hypothetical protein
MGVSRDTFNRYKELVEEDGLNSLISKSKRTSNLKNRVDDPTEQAVIHYTIDYPAYGQHRTRCSGQVFLNTNLGCSTTAGSKPALKLCGRL